MTASPEHPQIELLFVVLDALGPAEQQALETSLASLRDARVWTLGAPELVELSEEGRFGGILKLYSALPSLGEELPLELDRANLEEATLVVETMRQYSAAHGVALEFELQGETVGGIVAGAVDRSLAEGLLGEWRRTLDAKARDGE